MTSSTIDFDRVLKAALTERARGDSTGLLDEILRTAEATPQQGGALRSPLGWRRVALIAAAAVLLAGLAGAAAIGSGLIKLPDPPPPELDLPENGQLLTSFYYVDMAFAPDGMELAFSDAGSLYVAERPTDPDRVAFPCQGCTVAWDPMGTRRLAVGNEEGLRLLDATTGEWVGVLDSSSAVSVDGVTWSPDGNWIAFRERVGEGERLMQIRPDGSGLAEVASSEFASNPAGGETFVSPAWSPDGSAIAYLTLTHVDPDNLHDVDVVILTLASGDRQSVARLGQCYCLGLWPGLTWSPDGTQLAVNGPGEQFENTFGLFSVDAQSGAIEFLNQNGEGRPAWQPIP